MFNYDLIPKGYYDTVLHGKKGIRRAWHDLKFRRVISMMQESGASILDIGCFSGSLLGLIPETKFGFQMGIDILPPQIEYANNTYGTPFRKFIAYDKIENFNPGLEFDCITLVEVIEHLSSEQIQVLFKELRRLLRPGGTLIVTTPNYSSLWPLVEIGVNLMSDVSYEEQHLTKFTYFNLSKKLNKIYPNFNQYFRIDIKTTSHLIAPFLAPLSYEFAMKTAESVDPSNWKSPFGQLLILKMTLLS